MFVKTKNYNLIQSAIDRQQTMIGEYRPIVVVSGGFGTGKSEALSYISTQNNYPLVTSEPGWNIKDLLLNIAQNCKILLRNDVTNREIKDILKEYFKESDEVLLVDEADFCIRENLIETLRWLANENDTPLVLAGMANFESKLKSYPHLLDRSPDPAFRVRLKKIDKEDLVDIINCNYSDFNYTDCAIDYILATARGGYRQIEYLLSESSKEAVKAGLDRVTESLLEAIPCKCQ